MTLPVNHSFDYSLVQCLDILGFFCLFSSFFCLFWLDIPQRLVDITDMVQMGLSLSTSQQFAFWPGVALADGEHKLHLRWWELAVCPKGQWKVNVWSFCGGDLLHAHISLILLKWCSVGCMPSGCYFSTFHPQSNRLCRPAHPPPLTCKDDHTHTQGK